jgi:hypothetical protein
VQPDAATETEQQGVVVTEPSTAIEVEYRPDQDRPPEWLGTRTRAEIAREVAEVRARHTVPPATRIGRLASQSTVVGYARVASMTSRSVPQDASVVTDVHLIGLDSLAGGFPSSMELTIGGGTVDGIRTVDTSAPSLTVDGKVLVFATKTPAATWVVIDARPVVGDRVSFECQPMTRGEIVSALVAAAGAQP